MKDSKRITFKDMIIDEDLDNQTSFHNSLFLRIGAKKRTFKQVDFSHTYFEHCYFRDVVFDSCNFNGCKFINSNFKGSKFPGSKFDYATFDKTNIDNAILDNNCPSHENQIEPFARSLRLNYQSIGDTKSANKAMAIELKATKIHLYDAWKAKKVYYRHKYKGLERVKKFFEWFSFKFEEITIGHSENLLKLLRMGVFLWVILAFIDCLCFKDCSKLVSYYNSFEDTALLLFGIKFPEYYSSFYLALISLVRIFAFALLTSVFIKKYNRR